MECEPEQQFAESSVVFLSARWLGLSDGRHETNGDCRRGLRSKRICSRPETLCYQTVLAGAADLPVISRCETSQTGEHTTHTLGQDRPCSRQQGSSHCSLCASAGRIRPPGTLRRNKSGWLQNQESSHTVVEVSIAVTLERPFGYARGRDTLETLSTSRPLVGDTNAYCSGTCVAQKTAVAPASQARWSGCDRKIAITSALGYRFGETPRDVSIHVPKSAQPSSYLARERRRR